MTKYTVLVEGAVFVTADLEIEADDNTGALTQAEAAAFDELDWDELFTRTIVVKDDGQLELELDEEDEEEDVPEVELVTDEDGEEAVVEADPLEALLIDDQDGE